MFGQHEIVSKWNGLKGSVAHFFDRFHHEPSNNGEMSQPDGVKDHASLENATLSDHARAKEQVKENEIASLQDNSYAFDEDVTYANYDLEESLDFEDDDSDLRV